MNNRFILPIILSALLAPVQNWAAEGGKESLDPIVAAAARVQAGESLQPFRDLEAKIREVVQQPRFRRDIEDALIKLLVPDTTYEAKAFACKQLAVIGGNSSVPALSKLLENEQTAGIACIALQRIPGGKADQALRSALTRSSVSSVQIQVINTLGDRKDAGALHLLTQASAQEDPGVATAAVTAIGKIGSRQAFNALSQLPAAVITQHREAMAEARLACADNLARGEDRRVAAVIYNQLLAPDQPAYLRRAAFAGVVKLDSDSGQERILEVLRGNDASLKAVAIHAVRDIPAWSASEIFAAELPKLSSQEQAWMIDSFIHRNDLVARAAIANSVISPSAEVRVAGIQALATEGAAAVPLFVRALQNTNTVTESRQIQAAMVSLAGGRTTDEAIKAVLEGSPPAVRAQLLTVLSQRQGLLANRVLLDHALSLDLLVSKAALRALARTATGVEASPLLKVLSRTQDETAFAEARAACARALSQAPNLHVRSALIRDALSSARDSELRATLVGFLPLAADSSAWRSVHDGCTDPDARVRDAALEAIADWPNLDAWESLLEMYQKPEDAPQRVAALRALVRLASESNEHFDSQSIKRYDQLFGSAQTDGDYKMILGALGGAADPYALSLAVNQLSKTSVRAEANAAVQKIAAAIKATHPREAAQALEQAAKP